MATTFSFGFGDADDAGTAANDGPAEPPLRPAQEHYCRDISDLEAMSDWPTEDVDVGSGAKALKKRVPPESEVPDLLRTELGDSDADQLATSDLVPGAYEGGLKVWEGARDLLTVMHEMVRCGELALRGAAVLEAGCGAGLPGALATRHGARAVVMQDYNSSVLTTVTMHTFRLSGDGLWEAAQAGRVRFLSGDWKTVADLLLCERPTAAATGCAGAESGGGERGAKSGACGPRGDSESSGVVVEAGTGTGTGAGLEVPLAAGAKPSEPPSRAADERGLFDVILSAETIYCSASGRRLWALIRALLRPGGTALVAAKSYYFGVGGSTAEFRALVAADACEGFACSTVRTYEDGASNRREVLAITRSAGSST